VYERTVLTSVALTPWLLRAALRVVDDAAVLLVLDSTRCVHWEIFTLGVRWHGRVLPIAWSSLPYPWPKQQFTPTVVALLDRTLAHWPVDRLVHLVADRGFPSLKLFRCLTGWRQRLPLGYTIRLRASDWVRLAEGPTVRIADQVALLLQTPGTWRCALASYQQRGKVSAPVCLVLGYGQPECPAHQRGPADHARRQARHARRVARLLSKGQSQVLVTDHTWVLRTTDPTWSQAVEHYRGRFATEGTYRDLKTWDLEAVAAHESDGGHLDGLLGLAALTYLVQAALGAAAGRTDAASARARQHQWSTTDRLSSFWRGRHVLHDHAYAWLPWLEATFSALARQLRADSPSDALPTQSSLHQEAA
jgi:hypothetical protein